jgi:thiol-disulfide isomerase/thioredoxin
VPIPEWFQFMLTRTFRGRLVSASLFAAAVLACWPVSAKEFILRRWPDKLATPPLKLTDVAGRDWDPASLRGKVVLLNFWATWCEPCAEEVPVLNRLGGRAPDELVIIGVDYKESPAAIARFTDGHPVRYPVLLDKSGDNFKKWTSGVMPTTILIDRNGRPRWTVMGEIDPSDARFEQALGKLLSEPGRQQ